MPPSAEFQPTCLGNPLKETRPLLEEDRALIHGWIALRKREAWFWGPAWALLLAIPGGLALLLAGVALLGADRIQTVLVSWALIVPLISLMGLVEELLRPTRRWSRWALLACLASGAVGLALNARHRASGDLWLFPPVLALVVGLALFIAKTMDRSKLVRPSRVRRDVAIGELWVFETPGSERLEVLPKSGLLLRSGDRVLPLKTPVSILMAAAMPRHRWEIPARDLQSTHPEQQVFLRPMDEAEVQEGQALVRAFTRRALPIVVVSGLLAGATTFPVLRRAASGGLASVPFGAWLFPAYFGVMFIWSAPRFWRRRSRLAADIKDGRLVVVRNVGAAADAPPEAEVLPTSRAVWTEQGRIGPLRRQFQKRLKP
ncbi:MAG TPA: hypothetical protein VJ483_02205 [Holophagaceae bacterium]|nr:hypothetical protein [Holophagaceae bacterium]